MLEHRNLIISPVQNYLRSLALRLVCALVAILVSTAVFAKDAIQLQVDPKPIIVTTQTGNVSFEVEIADTDQERAAGLMFRTDLPQNRGMLFDFKTTRMVSMWMKNTPSPLDMLFVDESGAVIGIAENTVPQSLDIISTPAPVRYVLELNAGQVAANSIEVGAKLTHPLINQ